MFKPLLTGLAVVFAFTAASAPARTSYILPYNFAPTDAYVTAQAATSENVFTPEGALKIDAFQLIDSAGVVTTAKGVAFKELTLFESALPHEGTFRLTTGNREMRTMQMMQIDGHGVRCAPLRVPSVQLVRVGQLVRASRRRAQLRPPRKSAPRRRPDSDSGHSG